MAEHERSDGEASGGEVLGSEGAGVGEGVGKAGVGKAGVGVAGVGEAGVGVAGVGEGSEGAEASDFDEVAMARHGVLGVLEGRLTEEEEPAYFIDDIFYFAVQLLEQRDLPWLLARLEDPAFSPAARGVVAFNMSADKRGDLLMRLMREGGMIT